jgi:hypothetical protein
MARKTNTPTTLSLIRKIMIYLGSGGTFLTMTFTKLGIKDIDYALGVWLTALGVLQIIIDTFYRAPKEKDTYKLNG